MSIEFEKEERISKIKIKGEYSQDTSMEITLAVNGDICFSSNYKLNHHMTHVSRDDIRLLSALISRMY